MTRMHRKELLQRLLAVEPGGTKKDVIRQSASVVLRRGRFYTMSREASCSLPSGLDPAWEGAVSLPRFLDVLKELPDENVDLSLTDAALTVRGGGRRLRLALEKEIALPLHQVELPRRDDWRKLDAAFAAAVDMAQSCTASRQEFAKECLHLTPTHVEGSDDLKAARFTVPTFVRAPCLVRGKALKEATLMGMTMAAETADWVHLANGSGLRFSVRRYDLEGYPPLERVFALRGRRVTLPKQLAEAATLAGKVAEGKTVHVLIETGKVTVTGSGPEADFEQVVKAQYQGPPISFLAPFKLLPQLLDRGTEVEVTEASLRAEGDRYVYVTGLEMTEQQTAEVGSRLRPHLEDPD